MTLKLFPFSKAIALCNGMLQKGFYRRMVRYNGFFATKKSKMTERTLSLSDGYFEPGADDETKAKINEHVAEYYDWLFVDTDEPWPIVVENGIFRWKEHSSLFKSGVLSLNAVLEAIKRKKLSAKYARELCRGAGYSLAVYNELPFVITHWNSLP